MAEFRPLTVTRTFNAQRELVWKAWSDKDMFMKWWGPEYFTSPTCVMDFQVGGKYIWCMQSPEGQKFYSTGVFKEITPPEKIVYTDSFSDENGNEIDPASIGMPVEFPKDNLVTVTFEDLGEGKTKLTISHLVDVNDNMTEPGWMQSLNKLETALANSGN